MAAWFPGIATATASLNCLATPEAKHSRVILKVVNFLNPKPAPAITIAGGRAAGSIARAEVLAHPEMLEEQEFYPANLLKQTKTEKGLYMYKLLSFILILVLVLGCQEQNHRANRADNLVGLAYTTWHQTTEWKNVWGQPELGYYRSDDRQVIRQHGLWLADAGVDFIFVDWSNNVNYDPSAPRDQQVFTMIESATTVLFEEFAKIANAPKICIMAGITNHPESVQDGRLQKKVNQIYDQYLAKPEFRALYQDYLGQPLLMIYVNTPSPFRDDIPDWQDPRFTIRWVTGYIAQQHYLTDGKVSKYGYWSWEEREAQTYTIHNNAPEAMTVVASWREDNGLGDPQPRAAVAARGRQNGTTFALQWQRARDLGVKIALVVSWNEWHTGEQPSAEISKDLEPSQEFGHFYLALLKNQIKQFKKK